MDNNLYNLPFHISKIKSYNVPKTKVKSIVSNSDPPVLKEEITVKRIANALQYLNSNLVYLIDKNIFSDSYFLLTGKRLSTVKALSLVEEYYKYLHSGEVERLLFVLFAVNENITYRKLEFALLLINYFFQRDFGNQILLYPSLYICIRRMFKSRENLMTCLLYLKNSIAASNHSIIETKSLDDIKQYFEDYKNQILCRFPINRLYLFGSYAEGNNHSQSDLDILVDWNKGAYIMQDDLLGKELSKFISQTLKIDVDVLSFRFAIGKMDITSINKIISIY